MRRHKVDRVNVCLDWDKRRVYGWSYSVNDGDEIVIPMQSGKTALLRVKNLKRMVDPKDQYFADLEDVGYEEDLR